MKRYFLSLLAVAAFAVSPLRAQTESMRVNADRVNLRSAPSVDSGIVRALSKGTLVTVVVRDGNWVKVQLPGQTTMGWVRSDLLVAAPSTSTSTTPSAAKTAAVAPAATPPPPPAPRTTPPAAPPTRSATPPKAMKVSSSSSSDSHYRGGFTIFGGITQYQYKSSDAADNVGVKSASGFAAGAGIIAHIGGPIGIELDGAYVQKGSAGAGTTITAIHDNWVTGSLMLRPAFGSGSVRVFLLGGAEGGYLLSCKYSGTTTTTCPVDDPAEHRKRIDYSAVVGGGISFGPLAVQARYGIGVANLTSEAGFTVKSNGFMVLGSLIF